MHFSRMFLVNAFTFTWLPAIICAADCGASGTVLVKYSPASGNDPSCLGLQNLQGWHRANWPDNQAQNNSVYFKNAKDPDGVVAAHVHKDAGFTRSEYHSLNKETKVDTTYYIAYRVMFQNVDQQTIVFQWKEYVETETNNIPAALYFRQDADGVDNHTINLGAPGFQSVWSKQLTMGKIYNFGIVINTSKTQGFIQLYFNGQLSTLTDPTTKTKTQKLAGEFFPGRADPKFGLYDGKNFKVCDSYIYDVVIGTKLSDIAAVVGIST
ncbi:hypothetical protein K505DRAFT_297246 [Melanomma pulvis-pyrius CBS 109.77]|uniref:Concanavalin A-like lectin/glucanase n=1 Tax=Melanomma pulvis-pyrius CBS 109.77 TaxID=1314802 RepID=A0A6A6XR86_9PLEO|nr:hypothetical protein K505DRAFT_297246 [Melanomma pulvis-pyrius CBS 109.77]